MRQSGEICPYLPVIVASWAQANKKLQLVVSGNSMYPMLNPGDLVTLRWPNVTSLRPGDVIAFRQCGSTIIHRLLCQTTVREERQLCQKGDNCIDWSWVNATELLGIVECIHYRDKTIHLRRWPWNGINRFIGFWGRIGIIGHAMMPGVSRLTTKLAKLVIKVALMACPKIYEAHSKKTRTGANDL